MLPQRRPILAYADAISVRPGADIRVMVSCEGVDRYQADIVRLYCAADARGGPGLQQEVLPTPLGGEHRGRFQPVHPGSYVVVPENARIARIQSFTLQAYIWPTLPRAGAQAILGTWSQGMGSGFALVVEDDGSLGLRLGSRTGAFLSVSTGVPLSPRAWAFVAATYDHATRQAVLIQEPAMPGLGPERPVMVGAKLDGARVDGGKALLIGAWNGSIRPGQPPAGGHFNGRIEAPRVADRALDRAEIDALRLPIPPLGLASSIVGCWDFAREIGTTRVVDVGPNRFDGTTVNMPTRAVRGFRWTGAEMNWRYAPEQYAAIHFHADDLHDCGWEADLAWTVPEGTPSGCYAAWLRCETGEAYVPFFVRPPQGGPTAEVAFLAATATYQAYANGAKGLHDEAVEAAKGGFSVLGPRDLAVAAHPELGGSTYDVHADGSGVCHASRLRPMLDVAPKCGLWTFDAESLFLAWFHAKGVAVDVLTDEDLDADGVALLAPYRVVVTGQQPEYVTTRMWDAVHAYLDRGGRLMYLGGNGFYWRAAYHPRIKGVLEVRRPEGGTRAWSSEPGEAYLGFTGEYGGLWRRQGRPPNRLVGVGFTGQGFDRGAAYRKTAAAADPRAAFVMAGVGGETFGDFGLQGGGAASVEVDRHDVALGSPRHALVLARSFGHSRNWHRVVEEINSTHTFVSGETNALMRSDIVFFETPAGGAVFAAGSIGWGGAMAANGCENDVSRITMNVLNRFLDPAPFVLPEDYAAADEPAEVGAQAVVEGLQTLDRT